MKKYIFTVTLIVTLSLFPSFLLGAVWYVDIDNAGTQDGTGWSSAFTTLQSGIDSASNDGGGEVWVAEGVYAEAITMPGNVMLYGGFTGVETQLAERNIMAHPCVINASTADGGNPATNAVTMNSIVNAGLDGFTITGGRAEGYSGSAGSGGGIYGYNLNATVAIRNCIIIGNTARNGGGIYIYNSSVVIDACLIGNNIAIYSGSGIFVSSGSPQLTNCVISGNTSGLDGGCYLNYATASLQNCTISGNSANRGAGIYIYSGTVSIANCTVSGNASGTLGAITGTANIFNTIFHDNSPYGFYSGSASGYVLEHCLFSNNALGDFILSYYDYNTDQTFTHVYTGANEINLFADQAASNYDGDPLFIQSPSGTWNQAPVYDAAADRTTLSDTAAAFGDDTLIGRLINPETQQNRQAVIVANTNTTIQVAGDVTGFTAADGTYRVIDYHLSDGSPAIDRGDPTHAPAEDFEADPRPGTDSLVDIGVDETDAAFTAAEDTNPPLSMAQEIPDISTVTTWTIPFIAADAESGIKHVQLYFRKDGGSWTLYSGTYTESPITFDASTQGGDGYYEFYTLATDNADNLEAPPDTPDASITVITTYTGTRIYVDQDATGVASGLDWDNAFLKINTALTIALGFGVPEIWVAEGTYPEAIVMTSNLALYGGFAGTETQINQRDVAAYPTIIDASTADGGFPADHAVTMIDLANARLDGFKITGGRADSGNEDSCGGGIFCKLLDVSTFIVNCDVSENSAYSNGGGIYMIDASPQITNCEVSRNTSGDYYNGAIGGSNASPIISGCHISSNQGGGVSFLGDSAPIIDNCQIIGNSNTHGAYFSSIDSLTLSNSTIAGNGRSGGYAGLYIAQTSGTINRCVISGNLSEGISGYSCNGLVIANSIISGNAAAGINQSGNFTILNCTLSSNDSGLTVNGGSPSIINSIFADNDDYGIYEQYINNSSFTLRANLFYNNLDGDFHNAGSGTLYVGANDINLEIPGAEKNVSGDPLFSISAQGTWTNVTYNWSSERTTFTDANASFEADALVGRLINPDTNEYRQVLIVANTATTIEVLGDYTWMVSVGETYRMIDYHLQNGSAALDRGALDDAPTEDIEGNVRPGGDSLVDIGALEADPGLVPLTDTFTPVSRIVPMPDVFVQNTIEIVIAASDAQSGIQYIELFYRKNNGDWIQYGGQFTSNSIVFDASTTGGSGYYEFYTLATDNSGNTESVPASPQAFVYIIPVFDGDRAYVDAAATGYGTGESWDSPVKSISAGLILTEAYGLSEVWVVQGTYLEAITMPSDVAVYGGFAGGETSLGERDFTANPTVIDAATADNGQPAKHVVLIESVANTRVDGFTITGGQADMSTGWDDFGGGILVAEASGTTVIANCEITGNYGDDGGGIYAYDTVIDVINCVIENNTADSAGGVFFDNKRFTLSDSIIRNNTASREAGGIETYWATGVISNCEFYGNVTEGEGGGIYMDGIDYYQARPRLDACNISNNTADMGGGVYGEDLGIIEIDQCIITGNRSFDGGGGLYFSDECDPQITDSVIAGNQNVWYGGGGLCVDYYANFLVENTIISGNDGGEYGGGIYAEDENTYQQPHVPQLINCIVSGNRADYGGGLYFDDISPQIVNCTIGNNAATEGGGLYLYRAQPTVTNTLFDSNSGKAVYEGNSSGDPVLSSSLFYNNADGDYYDYDTSTTLAGADDINALAEAENITDGDPVFQNGASSTWTSAPVFDADTNTTRLTDSAATFTDEALAGTLLNPNTAQLRQAWIVSNTDTTIDVWGDISAFVQSGDAYSLIDYHLQGTSACIDTGTVSDLLTVDFDGFYRPVDIPGVGQDATGTEYDLGAYEYQILDDLFLLPTSPGFVTAGHEGQTFAPAQFSITLQNIGSAALNWSVAWAETWLAVTPASGSLAPDQNQAVTITITLAAADLPIGTHNATLTFTNDTAAVDQQRTVELRVRRNYFTEIFTNSDNDIDYQTLTLTPDGSEHFYRLCRTPAASFPTDPDGGTLITFSSHNYYRGISLLESKQVPAYGIAYNSIVVYANGFITYGGSTYNGTQESLELHFNHPRVSALFDDLDPTAFGQVSWKQLADRVAVTFENVPEYGGSGSNSFQVELFFDGVITITHLEIDAADGLVGVSEGLGLPEDFIESDLSEYACAQGSVAFLSVFYTDTDQIDLELTDAHLSGTGTQVLTVTSTSGDAETITLSETTTGRGIFSGGLASGSGAAVSGNGVLEVSDGDTVSVTYQDADDGSGNSANVTATAYIDSQPVSVSNVAVTGIGSFQATVTFETDEPATASVHYGPVAGSPENFLISDMLPQTTHTVVLPNLLFDTAYFFDIQATDVAGNLTTDDNAGAYYTFTTLSLPNLIAGDVAAPAEAASGQTISLSWTVTNVGDIATAGSWNDRVALSDDDQPGNDTYMMYATRLTDLDVGNSYQQTRNVNLPDVSAGTYWIVVAADYSQSISELDEEDNAAVSGPIIIGQPNLVISSLTAPDQTYAGATVNLAWTVTNNGADDASGSWYDVVYLAESEQLSGTYWYLGNYNRPVELAPAASYDRNVQVTIPTYAAGDYYFIVNTDNTNAVNETDETDNRAVHGPVVVGQPNLALSDVVAPATLITGQSIELSWTVTNTSSVPVTVDWVDRIYLSTDDQIGNDVALGSIARPTGLDPAGQYTNSASVYIPGTAAGSYWVIIKTDGNNTIGEPDENDNTIITGPIAVTGPDLIVAAIQAPTDVYVGESISIAWTVENTGDAPASGNWHDSVLLSDDDQVGDDQWLHTAAGLSELDAGASYNAAQQLAVPGVAASTYWLVVTTDVWGENAEIEEGNNTALFGPITIRRPNLTTGNVQIPSEVWTRQDYNLAWTVTNTGTVPTVQAWKDAVYLSTDDQLGDDTLLDEIDCPAVLAAGQQYDRALTVTIPEIAPGDYWILFRADRVGVIPETDEGDNVFAAGPIPLRTTPYANLQVSQAEFAVTEVNIGQQFVVDWSVVNVGTGPTSASFWEDRLYLSVDESLDATDRKIGERGNVSFLNNGESYASTTVVTAQGVSEGDYYVLVKTDATDEVYEYQAEDDNVLVAGQIHVSLPPPIDFIVTSVVAPALAFSGQPFAMTYQVTNVGVDVGDSATWYDDVYLSADTLLDTNADVRIARVSRTAATSRNPDSPYNVDYTADITVTPPVGVSGFFYVFVVTDATNRINEWAFENNNTAYDESPIDITLTPPPDLEVIAVTPPGNATAGRPFVLGYSVRNSGSTRTPNDRWTDAFFLSSDNSLDRQNDIFLGRRTVTFYGDPAGLGVDQVYDREETLTAPVDLPSGTYTIFVVADDYDQVFELNNANNIGQAAISIESRPADLFVEAIDGEDEAEAGKALTLSWTVRNQGVGDSIVSTWYDRIVVSGNDIAGDGDDTRLGDFRHDGRLYPNQSYQQTGTVTIPFSLSGSYYLFVKTDSGSGVFEGPGGDANNASDLHPLTINRYIPDLTVTDASIALANGQIDVQWTVANIGENRTNSNYWYDAVVASANAVYGDGDDQRLLSAPHSGFLETAGSYTNTRTFVLPASITGDVYLFVETNYNRSVEEGGLYANNVHEAGLLTAADIQALRTTPDLVIDTVTAPLEAVSGQMFEVTWTVKNTGEFIPQSAPFPPEVARGLWYDRIYLSRDIFLDPAEDTYIGQKTVYAGQLIDVTDGDAPYQTYTQTTALQIPDGMTGPFHIILVVDRSNLVAEPGGEDNNVAYAPHAMLVTLAPVVDLVVGTVTIPANVSVGSRLTIDYMLENQSDYDVTGGWWDLYYLSPDTAVDFGDVELGTSYRSSSVHPLPAQGSAAISTSFNLPGVLPGDYYLILRTDAFNQIREADDLNNFGISQSTVSVDMPALATEHLDGRAPVQTELDWLDGGRASFYFRFVAAEGASVSLTPDWLPTGSPYRHTQVSAYVAQGRIPTPEDYDQVEANFLVSGTTGAISSSPLVLTGLESGTYYVLLKLQALTLQEFDPPRDERFDLVIDPVQSLFAIAVEIDLELNKQETRGYYYRFDTTAGKTLMLNPNWLYLNRKTSHQENIFYDRLALTQIYVAYDRIATPYDYDFSEDRFLRSSGFSQAAGENALIIPRTRAGSYYVYVEVHDAHPPWEEIYVNGNRAISYTQERFNVILSELPFSVLAVEPATVGNAGEATLEIIASNLDLCSTVVLAQSGATVRQAEDIFIPDPDVPRAYVRFDLQGVTPGAYDIRVTDRSGAAAAKALEIKAGIGPQIGAALRGPTEVRWRDYIFYVNYGNSGDADGIAPLLIVQNLGANSFEIQRDDLTSEAVPAGATLQLLGIGRQGPAGILRPGELGSIPVFFRTTFDDGNFRLQVITADDPRPLYFEDIEDQIRPSDVSDENWAEIRPMLAARIGDTWGSYVRALSAAASARQELGERSFIVKEIFTNLYYQSIFEANANVYGYVMGTNECLPITAAQITAYDEMGSEADAVTTEMSNKYKLNLDEGIYTFAVKADGFATEVLEDAAINDGNNFINFYLKPQSSITGSVTFSAIGPDDTIPLVLAVRQGTNWPVRTFKGEWSGSDFEIGALSEGTYGITVSRPGYIDINTTVTLGPEEHIDLGAMYMAAEATISGQVSTFVPATDIENMVITVFQDGQPITSGYCDSAGNYILHNLLPGDYQLKVTTAPILFTETVNLTITEGQEIVEQDIQLLPGGTITGTVTDESTGLPLADIPVLCSSAGGQVVSTYSDADGVYRFSGLALAAYMVGLPTAGDIGTTQVQVTDLQGEYTANLSLTYTAVLTGIVSLDDDTPIGGASVQLMENDAFIVATLSDAEGRYKFLLKRSGTYDVLCAYDGASFQSLHDITIAAGETIERNLTAGTALLAVDPIPLVQGEGNLVIALYHQVQGQDLLAGSLLTQAGVVASFANLAAGDYKIVVTSSTQGIGSADVTLLPGENETLQLNLEQPFSINGTVTDAQGAPIENAWVNIIAESDPSFQRMDVSGEDGSFNIRLVPSGTYDIIASADGYEAVVETGIIAGISEPLELALPNTSTTVTGRLLDSSGLPVTFGAVQIYTAQNQLIEQAEVGHDGTFVFDSALGTQLRLHARIAGFTELSISDIDVTTGDNNDLGDIYIDPVAIPQGRYVDTEITQSMSSGITTQSFHISIGGWIDTFLEHYPQSPNQLEYSDVPIKPPCCTNCSPLEAQLLADIIPKQRSAWNWIQSYESDIDAQRATVVGLYVGDLAIIAGKCAQLVLMGYGIAGNAGIASAQNAVDGVRNGFNLANSVTGLVDFANNILQAAIATPTAPSGPQALADIQTATTWTTRLIGLTNDLEQLITGSGIPGNAPHFAGLLGMLADYKSILETITMDNVDQAVEELIHLEGGKAQWVVTYNNRINQGLQVLSTYQNCIQNNCEGCDDGADDDSDGDEDDDSGTSAGLSPSPPDPPDDPDPDPDPYDPEWVQSADPNDIVAPAGYGEEHWVSGEAALPYIIRFENQSNASAPAQQVVITQQLDTDLDYRTFRVTDFGWGDQYTEVNDDLPFYLGRIELTDGSGLAVDVLATVDVVSGLATWVLQTIDPLTGEPPEDALAGFLPPNDENGIGEGFVSYTIRPRSDAATWSVIDAEATIVFDTNEPIDTPPVFNTIDAAAPDSHVSEATNAYWTANIFVAWGGADDGGSALKDYNVYVSVDGGPYTVWLLNTTLTSAWFVGQQNRTYRFYCTSRDNAGNVEAFPSAPDSEVVIPLYEYETGDLNHDGYVDLADAVIALKVISGVTLTESYYLDKEVNADDRIGSEELVYILQKIANHR